MIRKCVSALVATGVLMLCACGSMQTAAGESTNSKDAQINSQTFVDTTEPSSVELTSKEDIYALAQQYMDDGDYENAILFFSSLGTHKDCVGKTMECKYLKAQEDMKVGKYEDAVILLAPLTKYNYKQSTNLTKECNYHIALQKLDAGNNAEAYLLFVALNGYEDSDDYAIIACKGIEKELYDLGLYYYLECDYQNAIYCFNGAGNYKDADVYLSFSSAMMDYEGVYKNPLLKDGEYFVIYGNTLSRFNFQNEKTGKATAKIDTMMLIEHEGELCLINDIYANDLDYSMITYYALSTTEDGKKCIKVISPFDKHGKHTYYVETVAYTKEDLIKRTQNSQQMLSPQIGMTSEEVKKSTWGEPIKINKSTYVWGTMEQWVYSGYRYVYLENGVVTAIQDRE